MLKCQPLFQKTGHYSCVELSFIEDKLEKFHVIMSVLPLNLSNLHTKKVNIVNKYMYMGYKVYAERCIYNDNLHCRKANLLSLFYNINSKHCYIDKYVIIEKQTFELLPEHRFIPDFTHFSHMIWILSEPSILRVISS